jgi:GrpB-like predicted nucleotidyltransferase (UPF0157 family)
VLDRYRDRVRLDPIVIEPYDPLWAASFERQRPRVASVLNRWTTRNIEHMGSTAVPGLPAKPIIDMLAVVDDIDAIPDPSTLLEDVEWIHAPEPFDSMERKLSFCFPDIERRTHHLHVVEESSNGWREWLAFRDYLRSHDNEVVAYASLKARLATDHGHDPNERDAYRSGKAGFIRTVTDQALAEGLPRLD